MTTTAPVKQTVPARKRHHHTVPHGGVTNKRRRRQQQQQQQQQEQNGVAQRNVVAVTRVSRDQGTGELIYREFLVPRGCISLQRLQAVAVNPAAAAASPPLERAQIQVSRQRPASPS